MRRMRMLVAPIVLAVVILLNLGHGSAPSVRRQPETFRAGVRHSARSGSVANPFVGETFHATTGKWRNSPTSYAYQWERCSPCSSITGATASTYTVASADEGHKLRVAVTASNSSGSATAYSSETGEVPGGEEGGTTCESGGKCYYVNHNGGSNANTGESEAQAWAEAPGMNGCTSVCASYSGKHAAGDKIIFKGGVEWPNLVFPMAPVGEGSAGHQDYFGVLKSWHEGASFTKPIFNAENKPSAGTDACDGHEVDAFIDLRCGDHYTLEDIAFENFKADYAEKTYEYGECAMVNVGGAEHDVISRVYIHSFYIDAKTFNSSECFLVNAASSERPAGNETVIEHSVLEGDHKSYGVAIEGFGNVIDNTVKAIAVQVIPRGHGTIAGNNLSDCAYNSETKTVEYPSDGEATTGQHLDMIQENGANGTFYYHDNVLHGTGGGGSGGECEIMEIGNPNHETPGSSADYVWGNVIYGIHGANTPTFPQNGNQNAGHEAWWNNTIEATTAEGSEAGGTCIRSEGGPVAGEIQPLTVTVQDNLCVSTTNGKGSVPVGEGEGVSIPEGAINCATTVSCTVNHNLFIESTSVASDHYSTLSELEKGEASFLLAPLSSSATGTEKALNLTGECTGALAGLCKDTTYAGTRTAKARPAEPTKWDAGAYQH
jgi:hypothetical protein